MRPFPVGPHRPVRDPVRVPVHRRRSPLVLWALAALGSGALASAVLAQSPPVVDGALDDLILYAADLRALGSGAGLDLADPAGDVRVTDPLTAPCAPIVDRWFANGFDLERLVVAQAGPGAALYLGVRTAGRIGDTDGDGDPDAAGTGACDPAFGMGDLPGVGSDERYLFLFDTTCGPAFQPTDYLLLSDNRLTGGGAFAGVNAVAGDGTFAFRGPTGRDLEIRIPDVDLPLGFEVTVTAGASSDGLSEDRGPLGAWRPRTDLVLSCSAAPPELCAGGTARLTLGVRNTGGVAMTVRLADVLPEGLAYAGNLSSDCGDGVLHEDGPALEWPAFRLTAGAACALAFDVRAAAGCPAGLENLALLDGVYEGPCVNDPPLHLESRNALACRPEPCSTCATPQLGVEVTAEPSGMVLAGESLRYTITVVNSSASTPLQDVSVTDRLCDLATWQGNAVPAPATAPAPGATGDAVWQLGALAPGAVMTIAFDAQIDDDALSRCDGGTLACRNAVTADGHCDALPAHAEASWTSSLECPLPAPLCRIAGGGCLAGEGATPGPVQGTFAGNVGPDGGRWQHVERDGPTVRFRWASADARVVGCWPLPSAPCPSPAGGTRVDFVGTGTYAIGPGGRAQDGNMEAYIVDQDGRACDRSARDHYDITVRNGPTIGSGEVVYRAGGGIECGDLQILRATSGPDGGVPRPDREIGSPHAAALRNRAYPNPFTGSTTFAYGVASANTPVEVAIYDLAGRLVKTLDSGLKAEGTYTLTWNGSDNAGTRMAPGVYFLRSRVGMERRVDRVVYLTR